MANLNTAVFDPQGRLWFTGQNGFYGRLAPATRQIEVWPAPLGRGPYGIAATPDGSIWYASLAGNHIARIDPASGVATVIQPPPSPRPMRQVTSSCAQVPLPSIRMKAAAISGLVR